MLDKTIGEYNVKIRFPKKGNVQENVEPLDIERNYKLTAEIEHVEDIDKTNNDGTFNRTQVFEIKTFFIE